MKHRRTALFLIVFLAGLGVMAAYAEHEQTMLNRDSSEFQNLTPQEEARLKRATRKVLCTCGCPPTLVDDCMCGIARAARERMTMQLRAGMTPPQIVQQYAAEHGEQYLAAPPKEGFHLTIWIFPIVAFIGLSVLFWIVLRRLTANRAATQGATSAPATTPTARYLKEIEQELGERKAKD